MKNASKVSLGELLRLERCPVNVLADSQYSEIGIYCFGRGIFHKAPRSGLEVGNKDLFLVREGDFILQITFAWEGAVGLATKSDDGMYCSTRFPTFRVDESRCFPSYLVQYFKTHEGREQLVKISPGSAGRNRVLSLKRIPEVYVPLPPLSEQKRITARIEELSVKVEEARGLRRQAVEEAEALVISVRNACFHKLSTDIVPKQLDAVADSRLGKMLSDNRSSEETGTPYIRNANVQWDRLDLTSVYRMKVSQEDIDKLMLESGDILVCEGGDIGKSAIWNNEIRGAIYQKALHRIRVDRGLVEPRFMLYHIFWASEQGHFSEIKTQTTIAHLTGVKLKAYPVYVPPLPEQRRIVAYLDDLQAKVDVLKRLQSETSAELNAMLPSVLDKAFKGELA